MSQRTRFNSRSRTALAPRLRSGRSLAAVNRVRPQDTDHATPIATRLGRLRDLDPFASRVATPLACSKPDPCPFAHAFPHGIARDLAGSGNPPIASRGAMLLVQPPVPAVVSAFSQDHTGTRSTFSSSYASCRAGRPTHRYPSAPCILTHPVPLRSREHLRGDIVTSEGGLTRTVEAIDGGDGGGRRRRGGATAGEMDSRISIPDVDVVSPRK